MWNLKMFMALMSALWLVACGDNKKKEKENGNGATGENAVSLVFGTDLANFDHTKKPNDFTVTVNKGDAKDAASTLEVTVEIVCGEGADAKTAKKAKAADKGVASFKVDEFTDIKFNELGKGTECTATATAEGATEGEKEFEVNDPDAPAGQPGIAVTDAGMVTVTGGTVNLKLEGCGDEVFLISWANDGTVNVAPDAGLAHNAPGLFVVGNAEAAGCKLTSGGLKQETLADYTDGQATLEVGTAALVVSGNTGDTKVTIHTSVDNPESPNTKGMTYAPSIAIASGNVVWVRDDNGVRRTVKT